MNDVEKKKLLMYDEIISFLRENREITSGVQGINSNISKLYRIMDEIRNTDKLVSSETLKKTLQTNELKEILIFHLMPLISALFKLAKDSNDLLLKERSKLSRSNLVLYKNYELVNKALLVSAMAEKHIKELNKYGIKNSSIVMLNKHVDEFQSIINDNGAGPNTAVFVLDQLFTQADSFILNIDEIIENNIDDEVFYEEYLWTKDQDYDEDAEEKEELLYDLEEN